MNRMFLDYAPHKGLVGGRINGVLISSTEDGSEAVAYGLWYLEERGRLFVTPGTKVYEGMIIGQNAKDNDLDVNPTKAKQLTNIRTTSATRPSGWTPIVPMTLEQAMAYIQDDELVEVTPQNIRLRKRELGCLICASGPARLPKPDSAAFGVGINARPRSCRIGGARHPGRPGCAGPCRA